MHTDTKHSSYVREFGSEQIEVIYRKIKPASESGGKMPELAPGVTVEDGIRIERDVAIPMSDGVTLYADIYRPDNETNIPGIIAWSGYGKSAGHPEIIAGMVPEGSVSPMARFEGPDPAYWCRHHYSVINVDSRGSGHSGGNIVFHGSMEAQDIHEVIEWIAGREWCNGKVGMAGNSGLAVNQWFAAASRPPHLAAIAPWEGQSDLYGQALCTGGIPEVGFFEILTQMLEGSGYAEDVLAMLHKYPLMNAYWEDKIPNMEAIDIPAYITANWAHVHLLGAMTGFRKISSRNKWLRVHNTFEWPDQYCPQGLEELQRFFDRYLRGIRNGWEFTPRVRLSILDPGGVDEVNRPENEFPLARTKYEKLFLDAATGTLSPAPVERGSVASYNSEDKNSRMTFTIQFNEDTELTGFMKLRLWVETDGADDMDLFVYVRKADAKGNFVPFISLGLPHPGAQGWLRVSHRELDESLSTPSEPFLTHRREQLLKPKEIVPVDIPIWPTGTLWHAGEQLQVVVAGQFQRDVDPHLPFHFELRNRGKHLIHTGGKFDSHLLVPRIPRSTTGRPASK